MAIWKSENSLLTQKGVEILNKVKAGVGRITVTRVVAGSGRVPSSQLYTQIAISGTIKPMTIAQVHTIEAGSEISISISNDGFTESFNINQIGVYVSHEDYDGEVLYHISQCEADGVDVVPPISDTPANFGYNLFLEHSNESSISITVNPQGSVSIPDFEEYKVSVENRIANLTYSDVDALPSHIVTSHLNEVQSADDLDTRLDTTIGQMKSGSVKFIQVTFLKAHPVLGGGNHIFRIDKISNSYCTIQSRSYMTDTASGGYVEFTRSKSNNVWTQWARTYNTFHRPTYNDVGAAPSGIVTASLTNIVSSADLDARIVEIFDSMPNATLRYVRANFQTAHPVLGNGDKFIEIFRANIDYGTIRAVGYTSNETGIFLEYRRSFYNRVWTNWIKIGSSSVVPATVEE